MTTAEKPPVDVATTIADSISAGLNQLGHQHGLAPLRWEVRESDLIDAEGSHPDGDGHPDAEGLVEKWAAILNAHESGDDNDGCRTWNIPAGTFEVYLYCITNADRYEQVYGKRTER